MNFRCGEAETPGQHGPPTATKGNKDWGDWLLGEWTLHRCFLFCIFFLFASWRRWAKGLWKTKWEQKPPHASGAKETQVRAKASWHKQHHTLANNALFETCKARANTKLIYLITWIRSEDAINGISLIGITTRTHLCVTCGTLRKIAHSWHRSSSPSNASRATTDIQADSKAKAKAKANAQADYVEYCYNSSSRWSSDPKSAKAFDAIGSI